jgi:hypothetical protein
MMSEFIICFDFCSSAKHDERYGQIKSTFILFSDHTESWYESIYNLAFVLLWLRRFNRLCQDQD